MLYEFPYFSFKKELPAAFCDGLIKLCLDLELSTGGLFERDGTRFDSRVRNNKVAWLNSPDIITLMYLYINRANEESGWNLDITGFQTPQFCIYEPGQFYDWHVDIGTETPGEDLVRKLTIVIALNENYTGGNFQIEKWGIPTIPNKYNTIRELQSTGTITVFPSFMHHRVTRVEEGMRYSLVGWFTGPDFK